MFYSRTFAIALLITTGTLVFACSRSPSGDSHLTAQKYVKTVYEQDLDGIAIEREYRTRGIDRTGWENDLNIQTSLAELQEAYRTNGVLPFRPLSHSKLIIGCGNRRRVREGQWAATMCIRSHQDADTINIDPHYDPTIVASFDFDGKGNNRLTAGSGRHIIPNQRYDEVISEGGGLEGLTEIERILRPGGIYFSFGSAPRDKILNIPKTFRIILVTGGSSGNISSRTEHEEAMRWRPFERSAFLDRSDTDLNRLYSFIIAKQREDGSFPEEAPPYMRTYLQDSWTAVK